ncbi:MAG TPA: hypothetical protein V6C78_01195 [Crinalium sp.]
MGLSSSLLNRRSEDIDMELPTSTVVNIQLVESLIQVIRSLSATEQALLLDKLLGNSPDSSTLELMHLAQQGGSFDFWYEEPDLYTLDDGEPIQW